MSIQCLYHHIDLLIQLVPSRKLISPAIMFVILIVVCSVNLIFLFATCALLSYIAKRRRASAHHSCSVECKDLERNTAQGNTLAPAGYSCVTLGSDGVYVMPSNKMQYPIPKGTPFGTTKKITKGISALDASTFLSSTVSSFNNSLDSFGVTLNGILSLNAQLEAIQRQTGEQRTSTKVETDLGLALDQVLAKHGQEYPAHSVVTDIKSVLGESQIRSNHGTVSSFESGYGSGLNSGDLGKALDKVLSKHEYRQIVKAQREQPKRDPLVDIDPSKLVNTW